MAYDKNVVYKEALELSEKMGFFFVQDIIDYLCVGKTTFYTFFNESSDELNTLKTNLYKNRISEKIALRKKFHDGQSSEKLALYKLICSDEERKALSMTFIESNQKITSNTHMTEEERNKLIDELVKRANKELK